MEAEVNPCLHEKIGAAVMLNPKWWREKLKQRAEERQKRELEQLERELALLKREEERLRRLREQLEEKRKLRESIRAHREAIQQLRPPPLKLDRKLLKLFVREIFGSNKKD